MLEQARAVAARDSGRLLVALPAQRRAPRLGPDRHAILCGVSDLPPTQASEKRWRHGDPEAAASPVTVGRCEIERELARGGMGVVYRARNTRLDRIVALKALPLHVAADPEARDRLEREARHLAALEHPHVAAIYGIEDAPGGAFLVLQHVEGQSLAQVLRGGPLSLLDRVGSLVNKSLVQAESQPRAAPRYRLLESVRQHAAALLHQAGESRAARDAHLQAYLAWMECAHRALGSAEAVPLAVFEVEHDNLLHGRHLVPPSVRRRLGSLPQLPVQKSPRRRVSASAGCPQKLVFVAGRHQSCDDASAWRWLGVSYPHDVFGHGRINLDHAMAPATRASIMKLHASRRSTDGLALPVDGAPTARRLDPELARRSSTNGTAGVGLALALALAVLAPSGVSAMPGARIYSEHGARPQATRLRNGGIAVATADVGPGLSQLLWLDPQGAISQSIELEEATLTFAAGIAEGGSGSVFTLWTTDVGARLLELKRSGLPGDAWQSDVPSDDLYRGTLLSLPDGGFLAAFAGSAEAVVSVTRFDASGVIAWEAARRSLEGACTVYAASLQPDGSVLLGGGARPVGQTAGFAWVMSFDATGAFSWEHASRDPALPGGHVAVASAPSPGDAYVAVRYNDRAELTRIGSDGAVRWCKAVTLATAQHASVMAAANGDALMAVETFERATSRYRTWIGRVTPDGDLRWQAFHDRFEGYAAGDWSLVETDDGEIVVIGKGRDGLWVIRLDANGEIPGCTSASHPSLAWEDVVPTVVTAVSIDDPLRAGWRRTTWRFGRLDSVMTGECSSVPPAEVSPPGAAQPLAFTSRETFTWEDGARSGATSFDVYRGDLADLPAGSTGDCFVEGAAVPGCRDDEPVPPSSGWFYLVAGSNEFGRGPLGSNSFGCVRIYRTPCP